MRRVPAFDMPLFMCFLIMVGLGIIFIFSASYPKGLTNSDANGDVFYYTGRQILYAIIGLGAMMACMYIPLAQFRRLSGVISAVMIVLLMLVLAISKAKHGNQAYISLGPLGQFQPSEFAKVAIVLTLSAYLAKRPWSVKSWKGLLNGPIWYLLVPLVLVGLGQDLGTVFVIGTTTLVILLVAGTPFRYIGIPLLVIAGLGMLVVASGHCPDRVVSRVQAMMNPEDLANQSSYHPRNALIGVGSGGFLGKGFCQSGQKWYYLPAPQSDYIFAVICEELGFVFTLLMPIIFYLFITYRGFTIAHRAPDEYGALVAMGSTVMLVSQAIINMAVVLNVLPSMGINLPFISYGGSSLIACMMFAGLLLNVSALRSEQPSMRITSPPVSSAPHPVAG